MRLLSPSPSSPSSSLDLEKDQHDHPLLPSQPSEPALNPRNTSSFTAVRIPLLLGKLLLLTLAVIGLISTAQQLLSRPETPPDCSCGGTTVAEAKARGCRFSPLAISWMPSHCLDEELSDQFDRAGPGPDGAWPYWADRNMTRPLTIEEVGELAPHGHFYTTQGWHVTHCLYQWRKELRSKFTGKKVELRNTGVEHVEHCEMVIKMPLALEDLGTISGVSLDANVVGGLLNG